MSDSPPPRTAGLDAGPRRLILVVEDEVFIALDLMGILEGGGYRVLGPAGFVAMALTLLERERPDAAILDVNLRGEMVTPVARLLKGMGVPFALASAYGRTELPDDEALRDAPLLDKPTEPRRLLAAVADMLRAVH